jgi:hypothetical protein
MTFVTGSSVTSTCLMGSASMRTMTFVASSRPTTTSLSCCQAFDGFSE